MTFSSKRREARVVEHAGERVRIVDLARRTGIDYGTLYYRWHAGKRGAALVGPKRILITPR